MNENPFNCGKLEIIEDGDKGWGVAAKEDIKTGDVIEIVPFIALPTFYNFAKPIWDLMNGMGFLSEKVKYIENLRANMGQKMPERYFFKWLPEVPLDGDNTNVLVLPLGMACLYNSRNAFNNASWKVQKKTFLFKAEKDIPKGNFVETFYGYYLDEFGNVFPCAETFSLALEPDKNGLTKLFALRFGDVGAFQASQSNPAYQKLSQLLQIAENGLSIQKIVGMTPDMQERSGINIDINSPLSFIYTQLRNFRNSQFPVIGITVEYLDRNDSQVKKESVTFRK